MTSRSNQGFVGAIFESGRSDAARPGAKARALAQIEEKRKRAGLGSGGVAGAMVAACIAMAMGSSLRELPLPQASPSQCGGGVEAPAGSCSDAIGGGSGSSSGSAGGSSSVGTAR